MKKKNILFCGIVVTCTLAVTGIHHTQNTSFSALALENIEALAEEETGPTKIPCIPEKQYYCEYEIVYADGTSAGTDTQWDARPI